MERVEGPRQTVIAGRARGQSSRLVSASFYNGASISGGGGCGGSTMHTYEKQSMPSLGIQSRY